VRWELAGSGAPTARSGQLSGDMKHTSREDDPADLETRRSQPEAFDGQVADRETEKKPCSFYLRTGTCAVSIVLQYRVFIACICCSSKVKEEARRGVAANGDHAAAWYCWGAPAGLGPICTPRVVQDDYCAAAAVMCVMWS